MSSNWQDGLSIRVNERPAFLSRDASPKALASATSSTDPEPLSPTSLKRQRALADLEGEGSSENQRKKRRLRLELITSRLSRPYASPTTNISSRSTVRVGIWTRQPLPVKEPFRKAAILNSIRRDSAAPEELVERRVGLHRAIPSHLTHDPMDLDDMPTMDPPRQELEVAKSAPLNEAAVRVSSTLSYTPNYDIFDDEDDDLDEAEDGIAGDEDVCTGLEEDSDPDDYGTLCPFDEVLIEHHQKPAIDSKPENSAIAREIQLQLPSERFASEPFF